MEEEQKAKDKAKKAAQREKEKAAKKATVGSPSTNGLNEHGGVVNTQSASSSKSKSILAKLTKAEVQAIGMSPEVRAKLDREKRYVSESPWIGLEPQTPY